jgi:hypothetical protein
MLSPNAVVSINRSTGAMTGHAERHFAQALPKCKGFAAKKAVSKASYEDACMRDIQERQWPDRAGSISSTKNRWQNRAAEGQPCARRGRRARAETKTDTAHPPVWRPS